MGGIRQVLVVNIIFITPTLYHCFNQPNYANLLYLFQCFPFLCISSSRPVTLECITSSIKKKISICTFFIYCLYSNNNLKLKKISGILATEATRRKSQSQRHTGTVNYHHENYTGCGTHRFVPGPDVQPVNERLACSFCWNDIHWPLGNCSGSRRITLLKQC